MTNTDIDSITHTQAYLFNIVLKDARERKMWIFIHGLFVPCRQITEHTYTLGFFTNPSFDAHDALGQAYKNVMTEPTEILPDKPVDILISCWTAGHILAELFTHRNSSTVPDDKQSQSIKVVWRLKTLHFIYWQVNDECNC